MAPKVDPKSMKNRGSIADAYLNILGWAPGAKIEHLGISIGTVRGFFHPTIETHGIQKGIEKSVPVKYRTLMQKCTNIMLKMMQQIKNVHVVFFGKDQKCEIMLPLKRKHEFTGSGHQQMHDKSIMWDAD